MNTVLLQFTWKGIEEFYKERIENQYIWHIFSFDFIEKEKYLIGKEARKAYDAVDKKGAIVFRLWDEQKTTLPMQKQFNSSKKLDELPETYVVASDFSWTYISTHENDCQNLGPYFMEL